MSPAVVPIDAVSVPTSFPVMSTVSDFVPEFIDAPPFDADRLTEYVISFAMLPFSPSGARLTLTDSVKLSPLASGTHRQPYAM